MIISTVLTDLDGTFLDHGGVLGREARRAVEALRRRGVSVVPLTSKTEVELREFLEALDLGGIGAFENGAGVVGPAGVSVSKKALGVDVLKGQLEQLSRLSGLRLTSVLSMTVAQVRRITGFPRNRLPAMLARRFDLPFVAPEESREDLVHAVRRIPGARLTRGGLFWHLSGDHGKEDSLDLLLETRLVTRPVAGFGDAPNDAAFLARCDVAVLIPGASGAVDPALAVAVPAGRTAPFPGGRGWAAAASGLVTEAV